MTVLTSTLSDRVFDVVAHVAALPDVQEAVEANHDDNRWWPRHITDPRMRMLVAGWSSRVSYSMVDTYARVVADANTLGFDTMAGLPDNQLTDLVRPIGLPAARIRYLRSLTDFLNQLAEEGTDPHTVDIDELINRFAAEVRQASFKVAQCAVLYARGYHCGVMPVDSGMVTRLAPVLGLTLPLGSVAHERMRTVLQACVHDRPDEYRHIADQHGYAVTIPDTVVPTWWAHLVLIYFKRLYLNRPGPRLCPVRPACRQVVDCPHTQ
jgi:endonuclease III